MFPHISAHLRTSPHISRRSTFLVVCADGTFFKCRFDPATGGECTREDWQRFLGGEDE